MQNLVIQDLDSWRLTSSGLSVSQLHIHNMLKLMIEMGTELILLENNYRVFTFKYPETYLLTYSMQQSPSWEANRLSANQEIPRILQNPKVHYRIHKCPQPVSILSQLDPVHTPTSHFLKIHLNIILPSTPGSPKCSFPQVSPPKPCICLSSPPYMLHAPSISFFLILSPKQYWVRSTDR